MLEQLTLDFPFSAEVTLFFMFFLKNARRMRPGADDHAASRDDDSAERYHVSTVRQ